MKLYTYKTLSGDITIKVDEKWHEWLTEEDKDENNQNRKHYRTDHKYSLGSPLSLDALDRAEDWLVFNTINSYAAVELRLDFEMALETLTPPLILTLCSRCKSDFEDSGSLLFLAKQSGRGCQEDCDFCHSKKGWDYNVVRAKKRRS